MKRPHSKEVEDLVRSQTPQEEFAAAALWLAVKHARQTDQGFLRATENYRQLHATRHQRFHGQEIQAEDLRWELEAIDLILRVVQLAPNGVSPDLLERIFRYSGLPAQKRVFNFSEVIKLCWRLVSDGHIFWDEKRHLRAVKR